MKFLPFLLLCCCTGVVAARPLPQNNTTTGDKREVNGVQSESISSDNSLAIDGEWDHYPSASGGGGGSVDWIHSAGRGTIYTLGIASYAIGGSQWTYGRGGASFHPSRRIFVHSQASLGGGQSPDKSFAYQIYQADVAYEAAKWALPKIEEQYIRVGSTRGNLLRIGALLVPSTSTSFDLEYGRSVSGNLNTSFTSVRLDHSLGRMRIFTGLVIGEANPAIFNVSVGGSVPAQNIREVFFGLVYYMSRYEFGPRADYLNLGGNSHTIIAFSFKIPIGTSHVRQPLP